MAEGAGCLNRPPPKEGVGAAEVAAGAAVEPADAGAAEEAGWPNMPVLGAAAGVDD